MYKIGKYLGSYTFMSSLCPPKQISMEFSILLKQGLPSWYLV